LQVFKAEDDGPTNSFTALVGTIAEKQK